MLEFENLNVEPKEDSPAKLAFADGKPTKYFLFASEFNSVVNWINAFKLWVVLNLNSFTLHAILSNGNNSTKTIILEEEANSRDSTTNTVSCEGMNIGKKDSGFTNYGNNNITRQIGSSFTNVYFEDPTTANYIKFLDESGEVATRQWTSNKLLDKVDEVSGKQLSTNDFTNIDKSKLDSLSNYTGFRGVKSSLTNIILSYPTGVAGDWAIISNPSGNAYFAIWDIDIPSWVNAGQSPTIPGTNLSFTISGNVLTITSDTGYDVTIPLASSTTAGLFSKEDKSKLDAFTATFTSSLKTLYDDSVTKTHIHNNKAALDLVSGTNTGDETAMSIREKVGNAALNNTGVLLNTDWSRFDAVANPEILNRMGCQTFGSDFLNLATGQNLPFIGTAISTGTAAVSINLYGFGWVALKSSATVNSGYHYKDSSNQGVQISMSPLQIDGIFSFFNTVITATTRFGFHNSTTSADAVHGAYFEIVGLAIYAKTSFASTRTSVFLGNLTATGYHLRVIANGSNDCSFYVYNMSGTLVYSTVITTNLPSAATLQIGYGVVSTNSGTAISTLIEVDYMSITRPYTVRGCYTN